MIQRVSVSRYVQAGLKKMKENIININETKIKLYIKKNRPQVEIRDKLDIGYSYDKNVIELFDVRPNWSNPNEFQNLSFAKIKYFKSVKLWKLYWMRASGKWQSYEPFPESTNLDEILVIIDEDSYGCFKG